ncbi:MAG TPA: uroporphyrinogen decarboxylase [Candidatus Acidoferrales bacterium]|jgi:uroporphyrinogen decarboxylase|nr:uroporphyrinogen decarboxylase [Candidatus Acidoferrales bacterium]
MATNQKTPSSLQASAQSAEQSAEISANALTRKELFLRAARCEPVPHVPVWMMRQAGRYLPEYRELRRKHAFLEVAKTPELAAEVSLQPFRRLGVDAVIVFSDILIPAEAMGLGLELTDSGPLLPDPVRDAAHVEALRAFDPEIETRFVNDAIRLLCRELGPDVPIIGFAAAPFTLACYMVDGRGRESFPATKSMMFTDAPLFRRLLEKIARVTAAYLKAQIAAGAFAVQLFDTWVGELSTRDYREFALPATQLLIRELAAGETPVIIYTKASNHLLALAAESGATVLSVDWRADLAEVRRALGPRVALQGNIDPCLLLGPQPNIARAVADAITQTGGLGHILNLGHGILPMTPVDNAQAFISAGQEFSLPPSLTISGAAARRAT